jgi:peptide/nickel transport system substrate-binding protein
MAIFENKDCQVLALPDDKGRCHLQVRPEARVEPQCAYRARIGEWVSIKDKWKTRGSEIWVPLMVRIFAVLLLAAFLVASVPRAYGHGLGFDESPPVTISDKRVSVEATLSPADIERARTSNPVLIVRAHDPATNSTIPGTDFRIVVSQQEVVLLDQRFRSSDGLVVANLVPDDDVETAQVNGRPASGEPVQVSRDKPADVRSKILVDGGLYHIAVTLERTSTGLQLEQDRTFDLYVSVSKTQEFEVETQQGPQRMGVKTYYAEVDNFQYDPDTGRISFSMPFDWSQQYVGQVPVVHIEVLFPKTIKNLKSNGYAGMVNGHDLRAGDFAIDDYSYVDRRAVHFVLGTNRLLDMAENATGNTMDFVLLPAAIPKFPLDLLSTNEKYDWQIAWGPEVIETGTPITFVMNVQNAATADLVPFAKFDFVITKEGREVHRQSMSNNIGTFTTQYKFREPGTYTIAAENIQGEGETSKLTIVVLQGKDAAPEDNIPEQQPQQPSGCLIATAAFGSELTPQVQFLRGFRDNFIMQSASGSAFMSAFNSVYYSFSPQVADYERHQPWLQATVRAALYPLFGILLASEKVFFFTGGSEAGTILAGAVASSLIGVVYTSPAAAASLFAVKKRVSAKLLLAALFATAVALAAILLALEAKSALALQLTTSAFVVLLTGTAALAVVRLAFGWVRFGNTRESRVKGNCY